MKEMTYLHKVQHYRLENQLHIRNTPFHHFELQLRLFVFAFGILLHIFGCRVSKQKMGSIHN